MFPFNKKEKKLYKPDYDTTTIEEVFEMFEHEPRLILKHKQYNNNSAIISSHTCVRTTLLQLIREYYKNECYERDEYSADTEMVALTKFCRDMIKSGIEFDWKRKTRRERAIIEDNSPVVDDYGDKLKPVILVKDKENDFYLIPKEYEESFDYTVENDPDFIKHAFRPYKIDDLKKVNLYFKPNF